VINVNRTLLAVIALLFGFYLGLLGIVSLPEYSDSTPPTIAIVVYFLTLLLVVLDKRGIRMRLGSAIAVLVATVFVSQLVYTSLDEIREGSYATWHIAALSTLLGIVAIRQHPTLAWLGFGLLAIQLITWGGPSVLFNSGLVGGLVLVAVAQSAYRAIVSSARSAVEFQIRAVEIDSAVAAASAARAEKVKRLQETMNTALPLLEKISKQSGDLDSEDKTEAVLLEAQLRDRIRGRALISEEVARSAREARLRGVEVQLLDDGGFDELSDQEKQSYLVEITKRLNQVSSGKVVIRASKGDGWRVSMAAIQKDADKPDLFIRL